MITVLIVDDSPAVRELLTFILASDPAILVIGVAANGEEAIAAVRDKKPDIVTMDIIMPKMDGYEATRVIMENTPTPIVVVSASWDPAEVKKTFRAMEAGALAALEKPVGINHPNHGRMAKELIQTVKLMAEVRVIRRRPRASYGKAVPVVVPGDDIPSATADLKAVAIGASTGGPQALETIVSGLPKEFPAPLLIVQHIAPGFIQGFADWLAHSSGFPVKVASHGEYPLPGHAYLAPNNLHMGVGSGGRILLSTDEPENGLRPAVSLLFRTVAEVFGRHAMGVLLTGMGKDGARELKLLREKGAVTIAQDEESSVVYGMPGEAVALDAATYVLPPAQIAEFLAGLTKAGQNATSGGSLPEG